jgi:hypothetical protein
VIDCRVVKSQTAQRPGLAVKAIPVTRSLFAPPLRTKSHFRRWLAAYAVSLRSVSCSPSSAVLELADAYRPLTLLEPGVSVMGLGNNKQGYPGGHPQKENPPRPGAWGMGAVAGYFQQCLVSIIETQPATFRSVGHH